MRNLRLLVGELSGSRCATSSQINRSNSVALGIYLRPICFSYRKNLYTTGTGLHQAIASPGLQANQTVSQETQSRPFMGFAKWFVVAPRGVTTVDNGAELSDRRVVDS